jgi:hypothetical protein
LPKPFHGFRVVAWRSLALMIHEAKMELRLCVALFGHGLQSIKTFGQGRGGKSARTKSCHKEHD